MDYFLELSSRGENQVAIFADDGEKFGVWPGTYDHVFKNQWLEQFFTAIEQAGDWVEMIHFSEVIERFHPKGRVYLPTASYREMMEWALPFQANRELEDFEKQLQELNLFDRYNIYVRGGFWRNFLAKYPESNRMHKKMLHVSRKINEHKDLLPEDEMKRALDHLWAGQCNCPYWHGVFGGLYLTHLRYAIYQNLIQAENVLEKHVPLDRNNVSIYDLTGNGMEEIIVETKNLNIYIDPSDGGSIFELDFKPGAVNLLDTMTRREEGYHRKLLELNQQDGNQNDVASIHDLVVSKEENLHMYLKYDWYSRNALIDHFLAPETTLEQFADCQYREIGDFVNKPYQHEYKNGKQKVTIFLNREGSVFDNQDKNSVRISKKLDIDSHKNRIRIEYRIKNLSQKDLNLHFGIEWNTGLLAGNSHDRYYQVQGLELDEKHLASKGELTELNQLSLVDEWQKLAVAFLFDQPTTIWRFPIETVSLSEGGFERVYQNSAILANWKFELGVNEEKVLSFNNEIENF